MSIDAQLLSFMPHTVTIAPFSVYNSYGEFTTSTNLIGNPSFEQGVANWGYYTSSAPALATLTQSSTQAKFGSYSAALSITSPASFTYWYVRQTASVTVTPSTQYTASVYLLTGTEVTSASGVNIEQYNSAGALVTTTFGTASATTSTTEWARRSVTFTTGASTTGVRVSVYTISRAGQVVYVDGVMLQQGSSLVEFSLGSRTASAYVEPNVSLQQGKDINEEHRPTTAYIADTSITIRDEITLPDGTTPEISSIEKHLEVLGLEHTVVRFR